MFFQPQFISLFFICFSFSTLHIGFNGAKLQKKIVRFRRKPLVQFLYHILIYTNAQLPDTNLRKYARYEVKIVIIATENNSAFHNLRHPFIVTKQKHPS